MFHPGLLFGDQFDAAIANPAATVEVRVGIEDFGVAPGPRHPDPVAVARHRRETDHYDQEVIVLLAQVAQDGLIGVVAINPGKALPLELVIMQLRAAVIEPVQILDQLLHPLM